MPTLAPEGMSSRYGLFRSLVNLAGKAVFGFEVQGEELAPRSGAVIVASNHRRFFDPVFVCMAVPRRIQWMAKKELFLKPLRAVFSLLGAFPVDRQAGGRSALRTGIKLLSNGWALGIFPEGTRRKGDTTAHDDVKGGAVLMAVRSGSPVVPVYIDSVPSLAGRFRGEKLRAYVGKPITFDPATKGRVAVTAASKQMIEAIYALREAAR